MASASDYFVRSSRGLAYIGSKSPSINVAVDIYPGIEEMRGDRVIATPITIELQGAGIVETYDTRNQELGGGCFGTRLGHQVLQHSAYR